MANVHIMKLTAVALLLCGAFAIFLAARREFLPHDIAYLGMRADELCLRDERGNAVRRTADWEEGRPHGRP